MTTSDEIIAHELFATSQLIRLGYSFFEATTAISEFGIDWHEVDNLLKNGCSHELALKIAA